MYYGKQGDKHVVTVELTVSGTFTYGGLEQNLRNALRVPMDATSDPKVISHRELVAPKPKEIVLALDLDPENDGDGPIIEARYRPEVAVREGRVFLRDYLYIGSEIDNEVEVSGPLADALLAAAEAHGEEREYSVRA